MTNARTNRSALQILMRAGLFVVSYLDLANRPTLGTAAALNVPANAGAAAAAGEVVRGDDSRLSGLASVGNLPTYVYKGTWAGKPAASGLSVGDRIVPTDVAANGGTAEFEVRQVSGTKYYYPVRDIVLAVAAGTLTGTDGSAGTLGGALVGPLTGAAAGVFVTLTNLLPAGLLTAPHQVLRVIAHGKKAGAGGTVVYTAVIGTVQFAGVLSGGGTNQDQRLVGELTTTLGAAYGSGTAALNGSASNQAVPVNLSNGAAQSLSIGYIAANTADSQSLLNYRVVLSAA